MVLDDHARVVGVMEFRQGELVEPGPAPAPATELEAQLAEDERLRRTERALTARIRALRKLAETSEA